MLSIGLSFEDRLRGMAEEDLTMQSSGAGVELDTLRSDETQAARDRIDVSALAKPKANFVLREVKRSGSSITTFFIRDKATDKQVVQVTTRDHPKDVVRKVAKKLLKDAQDGKTVSEIKKKKAQLMSRAFIRPDDIHSDSS